MLHAPTLGWRNVNLREPLAAATGLPVQIENSGRACALAQMWALRGDAGAAAGDLVFVSVSDGIGVGVIINGEVLRGRHNIAGRVRPRAALARRPALLVRRERVLGGLRLEPRDAGPLLRPAGEPRPGPKTRRSRHFTIEDLIARARAGDAKAVAAIEATARYLGLGLASVINALDPARVYIGGEITLAWDLIEGTVRIGARRADADRRPRPRPRFARSPPPNIRGCRAPRRSWPRPRSPRRSCA